MKYLWHGSTKKFKTLKVSKPKDLSGHEECNIIGIYATDMKRVAIGFGIFDKDSNYFGDYYTKPFQMVLIKGKVRKGKKFYLYKLDKKYFRKSKGIGHQFVSMKDVKPLEIFELKVDDYSDHWRRATKKDKKKYYSLVGKFGDIKEEK